MAVRKRSRSVSRGKRRVSRKVSRGKRRVSRKVSRGKKRKASRKVSRKRSRGKKRKVSRKRSRSRPRSRSRTVYVYGAPQPTTVYYQGRSSPVRYTAAPARAPTVTKVGLCDSKGYHSCGYSPMCKWHGTKTGGRCGY